MKNRSAVGIVLLGLCLTSPLACKKKDKDAQDGTVNCGIQYGNSTCALNLTGKVTTYAGQSGGNSELDGTRTAARFASPTAAVSDGTNMYVVDTMGNTIRKIVIATGVVTTFAGSGAAAETDGIGTAAAFNRPADITTDGTHLYVTDNASSILRKIVIATAAVTTLAGNGAGGVTNGTGLSAAFDGPAGICTDGTNLYLVDANSHTVRKVVIATAVVTTLAGSTSSGDVDGVGAAARFFNPLNVTCAGGKVYVADKGNHKIKSIDMATGAVVTVAGTGSAGDVDGTGTGATTGSPQALGNDGTNLYFAGTGNKVRKMNIATGVITTLAGSGVAGEVDGTGTAAQFSIPYGFSTDGTSLFVVDYGGMTLRKVE